MATYGVGEHPVFIPGPATDRYERWLAFSGVSVTPGGKQGYLDPYVAYQRACLHAIEYLTRFGYSPEQAYLLLGSAPIEGRLSGVVDIPNACATVYLPTAIFDFDVTPSGAGPHRVPQGVPTPHAPAGDLPAHSTLRAVPKDKSVMIPQLKGLLDLGLERLRGARHR